MIFNLFLISIFFLRLPSIYILPFLKSDFLTTQSLARVLIVFIFIYLFFLKLNPKLKILKKNRLTFFLIIIFFVYQSLSIFWADNIFSFLLRYKDVLVSFLAFFIFYFYRNKKELIIKTFLLAIIFNLIYQLLLIIGFEQFLRSFIYQKHFDLVLEKLERQNRLYTDTYDEIFLPFLLTNFYFSSFLRYFLFLGGLFFSFFSNIRSRFLMMVFSLVFFIFTKIDFKKILLIIFSFLVIGFLINNFSLFLSSRSIFDRIFFTDEVEDIGPIDFRGEQILKSFEIAKKTLIGVGLGNYFDILENNEKYNQSLLARLDLLNLGSKEYVHNIFGLIMSEVGSFGLIIFLSLLVLFIKQDIDHFKKDNILNKNLVISFWSLFLYGLFNPAIPLSYQFLFWGLRGLLL